MPCACHSIVGAKVKDGQTKARVLVDSSVHQRIPTGRYSFGSLEEGSDVAD